MMGIRTMRMSVKMIVQMQYVVIVLFDQERVVTMEILPIRMLVGITVDLQAVEIVLLVRENSVMMETV